MGARWPARSAAFQRWRCAACSVCDGGVAGLSRSIWPAWGTAASVAPHFPCSSANKPYARAGLIGNPSDGYFGKTISFIIRDFHAEVVLFESPELHLELNDRDESTFDSIEELARKVRQFGYYGGIRLMKASVKRFFDYCSKQAIPLHGRNFTLRYSSNVPPQVGMAGSSAIITACWRALMEFYRVEIPEAPAAQPRAQRGE